MNVYHCDEAVLQLPNIHSLVDNTRQSLQLVTQEGVELTLVIERSRPNVPLGAAVEASLAERKRSLRGFELVSLTDREYPEVVGKEARLTYVDKDRGPLFFHEFHCVINGVLVVYACSCRLALATACDAWIQTMLQYLKLR